jgi:hypothetical protein
LAGFAARASLAEVPNASGTELAKRKNDRRLMPVQVRVAKVPTSSIGIIDTLFKGGASSEQCERSGPRRLAARANWSVASISRVSRRDLNSTQRSVSRQSSPAKASAYQRAARVAADASFRNRSTERPGHGLVGNLSQPADCLSLSARLDRILIEGC